MNLKLSFFYCVILTLLLITGGAAQKTIQTEDLRAFAREQRIAVSEGIRTSNLGTSAAVDGMTAVTGAPRDDENNQSDRGAAFVFVRSGGTWTQQARLIAADGAAGDLFGTSAAISGETLVIGVPQSDGANSNQGAVYVFTRSGSTWTQQAKLIAADAAAADNFGASVSINNNTIAVGANLDDAAINQNQGSAYIFTRSGTTWTQQAKLTASDGAANSNFGVSVSVNADSVIVGANANAGAGYVFVRNGAAWTQQAKLIASDAAAGDAFGTAAAINGDVAVVGASLDDNGANADQGSIYVFQRIAATGTWLQTTQLFASDAAANDHFGASVGFDGTLIIAGANLHDVGANADQGSIYVFGRNMTMMFAQQAELFASGAETGDNFGSSVAVAGNLVIGGAPLQEVDARVDQGTAQAFFRNANGSFSLPDILTARDSAAFAYFGNSVALIGSTAVVGAPFETVNGNVNQGAVYIYTRSAGMWNRQAKIIAADGARGDGFGYRAAISGDTIVIGAFSAAGATEDQGAAYVYVRNGADWIQQAKLTANDGAEFDSFSQSVAISGSTIVVGANGNNINGKDNQGAAYVFTRTGTTWTQTAKLIAADGLNDDNFGWSAAIENSTIVVGSINDDTDDRDGQGSAYVFDNSSGVWTQTQKITMNDPQSATAFGASVSISVDSIAVGAFFTRNGNQFTQGAAYVFTRSSNVWTQQAKLLSSDGRDGDYFGSSVAIQNNNLIVSAEYDDNGANTNQGSVYLFERVGGIWNEVQKIVAADGAAFDSYGHCVALDGTNIVVGAPTKDISNPNSFASRESGNNAVSLNSSQGVAYFYSNAAPPTAANAILGGRVSTAKGQPISKAVVTISGGVLSAPRRAVADFAGKYRFENLPVNAGYVVTVSAKRFVFAAPSQFVNLGGDEEAVDFVSLP